MTTLGQKPAGLSAAAQAQHTPVRMPNSSCSHDVTLFSMRSIASSAGSYSSPSGSARAITDRRGRCGAAPRSGGALNASQRHNGILGADACARGTYARALVPQQAWLHRADAGMVSTCGDGAGNRQQRTREANRARHSCGHAMWCVTRASTRAVELDGERRILTVQGQNVPIGLSGAREAKVVRANTRALPAASARVWQASVRLPAPFHAACARRMLCPPLAHRTAASPAPPR